MERPPIIPQPPPGRRDSGCGLTFDEVVYLIIVPVLAAAGILACIFFLS